MYDDSEREIVLLGFIINFSLLIDNEFLGFFSGEVILNFYGFY